MDVARTTHCKKCPLYCATIKSWNWDLTEILEVVINHKLFRKHSPLSHCNEMQCHSRNTTAGNSPYSLTNNPSSKQAKTDVNKRKKEFFIILKLTLDNFESK